MARCYTRRPRLLPPMTELLVVLILSFFVAGVVRGLKKGSRLIIESTGKQIPFGVTEGIAVYLNGTDLEDEVYRTCDINFVIDEFDRLLAGKGAFRGYWEGAAETALFCYGASYLEMKAALAPFLAEYPLCAKARVEQIA